MFKFCMHWISKFLRLLLASIVLSLILLTVPLFFQMTSFWLRLSSKSLLYQIINSLGSFNDQLDTGSSQLLTSFLIGTGFAILVVVLLVFFGWFVSKVFPSRKAPLSKKWNDTLSGLVVSFYAFTIIFFWLLVNFDQKSVSLLLLPFTLFLTISNFVFLFEKATNKPEENEHNDNRKRQQRPKVIQKINQNKHTRHFRGY